MTSRGPPASPAASHVVSQMSFAKLWTLPAGVRTAENFLKMGHRLLGPALPAGEGSIPDLLGAGPERGAPGRPVPLDGLI